jgi:starvation-inducible DNA-binding protein
MKVIKLAQKTPANLSNKAIQTSVEALSTLLANTYLLYLKTQNYHWNVEDHMFAMLHAFLDEQYKELAEAIDEIAERIRMLDRYTPATFKEFLSLTTLHEETQRKAGPQMLKALLKDHEIVVAELREALELLEHDNDEGTIDFLIGRLRAHEKMAWMLRSHLKK